MAVIVTPADIAPFADIESSKLEAMIADATAMAVRAAPCLKDAADPDLLAAAKAIVRAAILRWHEVGVGGITQQTVGPFGQSVDTSKSRRGMFWPSEIEDLQGLCKTASGGAFSVDTAPAGYGQHVPWCSVYFGASCSCGSDLNRYEGPIFELP